MSDKKEKKEYKLRTNQKGKPDQRTKNTKNRWTALEESGMSKEDVKKEIKAHMDKMRSMRPNKQRICTLEQVKDALEVNKGYMGNTAKYLGIGYGTIHNYVNKVWPEELQPLLKTIRERRTDRVESKMIERIDEGSDYLIRYYLSSQAKDRGYGEQAQTPANQTINILYVNDWRNPELDVIEGDYEKLSGESGVSEGDQGAIEG